MVAGIGIGTCKAFVVRRAAVSRVGLGSGWGSGWRWPTWSCIGAEREAGERVERGGDTLVQRKRPWTRRGGDCAEPEPEPEPEPEASGEGQSALSKV